MYDDATLHLNSQPLCSRVIAMKPTTYIRIRIPHGDDFAMGPGKAALLEAMQRTGSISAAGYELNLFYQRAPYLSIQQITVSVFHLLKQWSAVRAAAVRGLRTWL